ncbi:MAG: hypothetical protein ABSB80_02155 [Methanoregula sp.]|jgi:hypothetical protein|uniref:hypothetical protein n=1 Tax=Methanoregula sp. TaxID=2052170 RepID=UPI003D0B62A7
MAGMSDDAQWIILMGFIVSFSLFFLATVIDQSTLVGQTTAENVQDFGKSDIRDIRAVIIDAVYTDPGDFNSPPGVSQSIQTDIRTISLARKGAVVNYSSSLNNPYTIIQIHYNNGVTVYNETWTSP